ncbi:MAG: sugar kinase [Chloroflexi bacterium]|nr:sugar kinase [Chloroflexota bacterium]
MTQPQKLDVVTLGESMVLLLAEQSGPMREATTFRRYIAGAESNLAIGLSRLGHAAGWISRVGDDEFGRAIVFRIRGEGVDTSHVISDDAAPTGLVIRERRDVGPIEQVYYRRGSAASRLAAADLDAAYVGSARFLHLTGITPALSESCRQTVFAAADMARAAGVRVVLDPNYRSKLWAAPEAREVLRMLARHCDILLPGMDEAQLLTGLAEPEQAARELIGLGPRLVVIKLGAQGALALDAHGQVTRAPAVVVERIVDPVGAGDAFAAGLLSGLLRDFTLAGALALANRCGALAMLSAGDMEALPRRAELAGGGFAGDIRR